MEKRAQVTIFIIIAVLVIGAVALFFTLRGDLQREEVYSPEVAPIVNFVEECIYDTGEEVIYTIGQGGGYYFPPEKSTETGIAYYLLDGQNYMPSKLDVEREISFFVSEKLFFCTRNFVDFSDYEIEQGEIRINSKIQANKVVLDVDYPLTISRGESVSVIKDFEVEIPVRLNVVYDSVKEFVNEDSEEGICLSCLLNISETNDLYVDMFEPVQ